MSGIVRRIVSGLVENDREWEFGPRRSWAALLNRWMFRNVLASPTCL